jgi:hypothetical protein
MIISATPSEYQQRLTFTSNCNPRIRKNFNSPVQIWMRAFLQFLNSVFCIPVLAQFSGPYSPRSLIHHSAETDPVAQGQAALIGDPTGHISAKIAEISSAYHGIPRLIN